jgi:hypothetical protein
MNLNDMTPAQMEVFQARSELESTHRRLLAQTRTVMEKMARFAERLEAHGPARANVNELGELQGYAGDLDRLCATFTMEQRFLKTLERLAAQSEGGAS